MNCFSLVTSSSDKLFARMCCVCVCLISIWCSCMNLVSFYHIILIRCLAFQFDVTMTTLFCRSTKWHALDRTNKYLALSKKIILLNVRRDETRWDEREREREWVSLFPVFQRSAPFSCSPIESFYLTQKLARFRYTRERNESEEKEAEEGKRKRAIAVMRRKYEMK